MKFWNYLSTSPLYLFGDFYWIFVGWFFKLSVQMFQPLIVIYRRVNFVYYYWEWTSIYRLLSHPFWSLIIQTYNLLFREYLRSKTAEEIIMEYLEAPFFNLSLTNFLENGKPVLESRSSKTGCSMSTIRNISKLINPYNK